jgi:PAS domain S-box-containing protein
VIRFLVCLEDIRLRRMSAARSADLVPDLAADPRFASNPLVQGEPHLRFYAGAPLMGAEGLVLGTVSVLDTEPRSRGLSVIEQRGLVTLAAMAADELELRLQVRLSREAAAEAEAARAAEERLRRAQEAAGVVAFEFVGRRCEVRNAAAASMRLREILGHQPDENFSFRHSLAAVSPEDRAGLAAEVRKLIRNGGEFRHEFRVFHAGALAWRWLQARGQFESVKRGRRLATWRLSGVVLDITERKETEIALREAETRQRTLFEAAPFAVIVIDPASHEILDVNDRACDEYGYTREEFLRMSIADVDALGDSEAIRRRGRAHVVRPGTQELEVQHRTKSGEIRDVLVRVHGVMLGGRDVSYGAHFDITARKAAETRLGRLAAILEATPDFVGIADARNGRATYLNAAFRRLLALPPEAEAYAVAIADCHAPEAMRLLTETAIPEALRTGSWVGENTVRAADGRNVPVSQLVLAHRSPAGQVESMSTVMRDLTERKRGEEERLLLMREVDHRAKNVLAVVQAALRLTPKNELESYAAAVEGRVMALARAHSLLSDRRWAGADVRVLLEGELSAFLSDTASVKEGAASDTPRAELTGPPVTVEATTAQGLSIALHELATNATKHGALSVPGGRLRVSWEVRKRARLHLRWIEAGGPNVIGAPTRFGFGTRVIEATIRRQLGGGVQMAWELEGLVCELDLPLAPANRTPLARS